MMDKKVSIIVPVYNVERVTMIDFNYYYYRQREGSLMNSDNKEFRINSLIIVAKEIKKLTRRLKKEKKSTELIICLYAKILRLFRFINNLRQETDTNTNGQWFLSNRFYTKLLLEIYHELPYEKQRECLKIYYN